MSASALFLALSACAQAAGLGGEWARFSVLTPSGPEEPSPQVLRELNGLVYAVHKVRSGDNMARLAKECGSSLETLQATNDNELILLRPGAKITVPNKRGFLYTVKKESETLDSILTRYRYRNANVKPRELKERVIADNDLPGIALLAPYTLSKGEVLLLPEVKVHFDTYQFPFQHPGWSRISSGFGQRRHPILKYRRMHDGLDLPKPFGTPVYPSRSGEVTKAGWYEGYGNMVEVRHTDGAYTRYGHLSKVLVAVGDKVGRGKTVLGRVGSSGLSTGPHLHFEVRDRRGRAVNPRYKIGSR